MRRIALRLPPDGSPHRSETELIQFGCKGL
jgi:hypothetical protein